jgi:imidazolonepropionase
MSRVLTNIGELAVCPDRGGQGEIGLVRDSALVWDEATGRVAWTGPGADLPHEFRGWPTEDAGGRVVIPGLVDCHTHLAFAGWRADEFALRCQGAGYSQLAAIGGGIARTVALTRQATEEELYTRAHGFLMAMVKLGVTTVECKSGYGLTLDDELKLLRVYRRLRERTPFTIVSTFLGAHVVPPEFKQDRDGYIRLVCESMIPAVATQSLARFCDVFVDHSAFSNTEARRIFRAGKANGLRPKVHADQLTNDGAAALAAAVGAASADHLEFASNETLVRMARAGVVAVLLPLASLTVHVPPLDARRCLKAGLAVAVATDFNPGSAPSYHLPFALSLACAINRLSPAEALKGATLYAARAIEMDREVGSLEPGKRADFVLLDAESVDHWLYHTRPNAAAAVFVGGRRCP